jgi:predicted nucleic acid-binding protein
MSSNPKYVFDVGVIALSHAATPVSKTALDYIKSAIRGEVIGIVPTAAMLGAHHVLRNNYHIRRDVASDLLRNLQSAMQLEWYETIQVDAIEGAFDISGRENIESWDGYYAEVARNTSADKIITLDDDFDRVTGIEFEVILDENEFQELHDYMDSLNGIRAYDDLNPSL